MIDTKVFVPVHDVFPEVPNDFDQLFESFKDLLATINFKDAIFLCSHLNWLVTNAREDHHSTQQNCLDLVFSEVDIDKINDFVKREAGNDASRVSVVSRGTCLTLMQGIFLFCDDADDVERSTEDPAIKRNFAIACLIANSLWHKLTFPEGFGQEDEDEARTRSALGTMREGIRATRKLPRIEQSLGRGNDFFKNHFPKYYPAFKEEFEGETNLTLDEYYLCVTLLFTHFRKVHQVTNMRDFIENSLHKDLLVRYFALETKQSQEIAQEWNGHSGTDITWEKFSTFSYLPLRKTPIYFLSENELIILDLVFFSEKASIGPLFHLPRKNRAQIFAQFGYAFEDYICTILSRMFPDLTGAPTKRLQCNLSGETEGHKKVEIDACLNDFNEIVLFEIKSSFIPEDQIVANDPELYAKQVDSKYLESNGRLKGIGQLSRIVSLITEENWKGPNLEFSHVEKIYPVLIVHDILLNAPLHAKYLAKKFEEFVLPDETYPDGILKKNQFSILLPIILTVDDLENLESVVKNVGFRDLLFEYSREAPKRGISFYNFVAYSEYRNIVRSNNHISKFALNMLNECGYEMFNRTD